MGCWEGCEQLWKIKLLSRPRTPTWSVVGPSGVSEEEAGVRRNPPTICCLCISRGEGGSQIDLSLKLKPKKRKRGFLNRVAPPSCGRSSVVGLWDFGPLPVGPLHSHFTGEKTKLLLLPGVVGGPEA